MVTKEGSHEPQRGSRERPLTVAAPARRCRCPPATLATLPCPPHLPPHPTCPAPPTPTPTPLQCAKQAQVAGTTGLHLVGAGGGAPAPQPPPPAAAAHHPPWPAHPTSHFWDLATHPHHPPIQPVIVGRLGRCVTASCALGGAAVAPPHVPPLTPNLPGTAHPHLHPTTRVPALLALPLVPPGHPQPIPRSGGCEVGWGMGQSDWGWQCCGEGMQLGKVGPCRAKNNSDNGRQVDFPNFLACLLLYRPPASSRRAMVEQRRSEAAEQATAGCRRTPKLAQ